MLKKIYEKLFPGNAFAAQRRAYRKGLAKAQAELTALRQKAHDEGFESGRQVGWLLGRDQGKVQGEHEGQRIGQERAWWEVLTKFAITDRPPPREWHVPDNAIPHGPYANIYDEPGGVDGNSYVVRVIIAGGRLEEDFPYLPGIPDSRKDALLKAMQFRHMHTAGYGNTLADRIAADVINLQSSDGGRITAYAALAEFHRRMLEHFPPGWVDTWLTTAFLGEDPATWLPGADPRVFTRPVEWVESDKWFEDAAEDMGLENRTVRDLCLFTAEDFLDSGFVGPQRLKSLRSRLTELGLALWDDPRPRAAGVEKVREGRAITLD